jgi:hypothetical protein
VPFSHAGTTNHDRGVIVLANKQFEHLLEDQYDGEQKLPVQVLVNPTCVCVELHTEEGVCVASALVEFYQGKLQVLVWDTKDEEKDPTVVTVMAKDAVFARTWRFDENGDPLPPAGEWPPK